jgi:hypothetical protein
MSLGLVPDFLYNVPLQALSTPGGPGPLGLAMIDRNFVQDPGFAGLGARTKMTGRHAGVGCVGCSRPGTIAGPVGFVAVEGRPLAGPLGVSWMTWALGAAAGVGAGYVMMRRKGRRIRLPRFIRRLAR